MIIIITCHNRALRDCGLWHQSVATPACRALETETTVQQPHGVSTSGIRAGLASGLQGGVSSVFTLVTGR